MMGIAAQLRTRCAAISLQCLVSASQPAADALAPELVQAFLTRTEKNAMPCAQAPLNCHTGHQMRMLVCSGDSLKERKYATTISNIT
jgi:hypothetical protein